MSYTPGLASLPLSSQIQQLPKTDELQHQAGVQMAIPQSAPQPTSDVIGDDIVLVQPGQAQTSYLEEGGLVHPTPSSAGIATHDPTETVLQPQTPGQMDVEPTDSEPPDVAIVHGKIIDHESTGGKTVHEHEPIVTEIADDFTKLAQDGLVRIDDAATDFIKWLTRVTTHSPEDAQRISKSFRSGLSQAESAAGQAGVDFFSYLAHFPDVLSKYMPTLISKWDAQVDKLAGQQLQMWKTFGKQQLDTLHLLPPKQKAQAASSIDSFLRSISPEQTPVPPPIEQPLVSAFPSPYSASLAQPLQTDSLLVPHQYDPYRETDHDVAIDEQKTRPSIVDWNQIKTLPSFDHSVVQRVRAKMGQIWSDISGKNIDIFLSTLKRKIFPMRLDMLPSRVRHSPFAIALMWGVESYGTHNLSAIFGVMSYLEKILGRHSDLSFEDVNEISSALATTLLVGGSGGSTEEKVMDDTLAQTLAQAGIGSRLPVAKESTSFREEFSVIPRPVGDVEESPLYAPWPYKSNFFVFSNMVDFVRRRESFYASFPTRSITFTDGTISRVWTGPSWSCFLPVRIQSTTDGNIYHNHVYGHGKWGLSILESADIPSVESQTSASLAKVQQLLIGADATRIGQQVRQFGDMTPQAYVAMARMQAQGLDFDGTPRAAAFLNMIGSLALDTCHTNVTGASVCGSVTYPIDGKQIVDPGTFWPVTVAAAAPNIYTGVVGTGKVLDLLANVAGATNVTFTDNGNATDYFTLAGPTPGTMVIVVPTSRPWGNAELAALALAHVEWPFRNYDYHFNCGKTFGPGQTLAFTASYTSTFQHNIYNLGERPNRILFITDLPIGSSPTLNGNFALSTVPYWVAANPNSFDLQPAMTAILANGDAQSALSAFAWWSGAVCAATVTEAAARVVAASALQVVMGSPSTNNPLGGAPTVASHYIAQYPRAGVNDDPGAGHYGLQPDANEMADLARIATSLTPFGMVRGYANGRPYSARIKIPRRNWFSELKTLGKFSLIQPAMFNVATGDEYMDWMLSMAYGYAFKTAPKFSELGIIDVMAMNTVSLMPYGETLRTLESYCEDILSTGIDRPICKLRLFDSWQQNLDWSINGTFDDFQRMFTTLSYDHGVSYGIYPADPCNPMQTGSIKGGKSTVTDGTHSVSGTLDRTQRRFLDIAGALALYYAVIPNETPLFAYWFRQILRWVVAQTVLANGNNSPAFWLVGDAAIARPVLTPTIMTTDLNPPANWSAEDTTPVRVFGTIPFPPVAVFSDAFRSILFALKPLDVGNFRITTDLVIAGNNYAFVASDSQQFTPPTMIVDTLTSSTMTAMLSRRSASRIKSPEDSKADDE
jgi:hypothetical protein